MKNFKKNNSTNENPILHINGVPSFKNLDKKEYHSFIVALEFATKNYYKDKNNGDINKLEIPP